MKFSELLTDIGRPVAYAPKLAILIGVKECVLLSQLLYWSDKAKDGWIYKSVEELEEETGLSYGEQLSARKSLSSNGLLTVRNERESHRLYFKVNTEKLDALWSERKSIRRTRDTSAATTQRWEGAPTSDVDGSTYVERRRSDTSDGDGHLRPTDSDSNTETTGTETTNKPAEAGDASKKLVSVKTASDFKAFVDWWHSEFPKFHDDAIYVFQSGKDGSALKRILSTLRLEQLQRITLAAWKQSDLFNCKQAVTIAGLCSRINQIRDELNSKRSSKPKVSAGQEIHSLETERREKFPQLEAMNEVMGYDCNKTPENIAKRKTLRERVAAIDVRLTELRK